LVSLGFIIKIRGQLSGCSLVMKKALVTGDRTPISFPYFASFEKWKKLTGETSWNSFKLAIVKLWWSRFTTAYHLQEPYKLTLFNPIGSEPEKGGTTIIARSGTDTTTFRDSKIDAIATMFYYPSASKIWNNLDQVYKADNTYSYPTQLPVLMSTEIGIGRLNTLPYTQEFMIIFLERGSQGLQSIRTAIWRTQKV